MGPKGYRNEWRKSGMRYKPGEMPDVEAVAHAQPVAIHRPAEHADRGAEAEGRDRTGQVVERDELLLTGQFGKELTAQNENGGRSVGLGQGCRWREVVRVGLADGGVKGCAG